jgi:hypothetical protein
MMLLDNMTHSPFYLALVGLGPCITSPVSLTYVG